MITQPHQCVIWWALKIALYSCEGGICVVNDLLDGLERTSDKLPAIGTGRAIFNAVNAKADWLNVDMTMRSVSVSVPNQVEITHT